jgi:hypothetical protein
LCLEIPGDLCNNVVVTATAQKTSAEIRCGTELGAVDDCMGTLIVTHVSYAVGTELEEIQNGTAEVTGYTATQDGRQAWPAWAFGDGEAEATEIYYERFDENGLRRAHGWVDAKSRKIVQTG